MKFTHEQKTDDRECVAYIDDDFLVINDKEEGPVWISYRGIGKNGGWDPSSATHKFYPGDKLEIEF